MGPTWGSEVTVTKPFIVSTYQEKVGVRLREMQNLATTLVENPFGECTVSNTYQEIKGIIIST